MTLGFAGLGAAGLLAAARVIAAPASGAAMRRTGPAGGLAGGVRQRRHRQPEPRATGARRSSGSCGAWRRATRTLAFHEVRYRVKSWKRLDMCIEDARAALDAVAGPRRAAGR